MHVKYLHFYLNIPVTTSMCRKRCFSSKRFGNLSRRGATYKSQNFNIDISHLSLPELLKSIFRIQLYRVLVFPKVKTLARSQCYAGKKAAKQNSFSRILIFMWRQLLSAELRKLTRKSSSLIWLMIVWEVWNGLHKEHHRHTWRWLFNKFVHEWRREIPAQVNWWTCVPLLPFLLSWNLRGCLGAALLIVYLEFFA